MLILYSFSTSQIDGIEYHHNIFFKICIIIVFFYLFNDLIRGKPENMQITLLCRKK